MSSTAAACLALGILLLLARRRTAGANNANHVSTVGVHHYHKQLRSRLADRHEARFAHRMVWIRNRSSEWISEDCGGFLERNPMATKIRLGLPGIPLELHAACYREGGSPTNLRSAEHWR